MNVADNEIKTLLSQYKKMTVYGLSPNNAKPSHRVPLFMRNQGYEIVGIYPREGDIAGFKVYQNLKEVPLDYRKFVDVFRSPDNIPAVVDEVLACGGVEVLWLQLGITHPEAERRAEAAGIKVVSNRCLHIEYERWF